MFNDNAAVPALVRHGYTESEARDYAIVGCVEPSLPGRSFFSTDAALCNLPLCLLLALNAGRRPGRRRRIGAPTPGPAALTSMAAVIDAFTIQVAHLVGRLVADLQIVERGNRDFHPTPLSSMLVDGCIESGRDVTAGGARCNASGIQGVGVADVADSLSALRHVVFERRAHNLETVVAALAADFAGAGRLLAALLGAPKFGNDLKLPDGYAARVMQIFHDALARHRNTRGGPYVPGFYSSTCHVGFGGRTGALPSGRRAGAPLAASLGCANGMDRRGVTALLNSVAHLDATLAMNGYALNLRFDRDTVAGDKGLRILTALTEGFFNSGGLELQFNVLDPGLLAEARRHPGRHPGIVVRVAGYCAYFDDLPDAVKQEIIARTRLTL